MDAAPRAATPLNAANAVSPVSAHFEELKRDMGNFLEVFNQWIDERRRTMTDDKDIFMKTIAEERDTIEALKRQHQQLLAKRQQVGQCLDEEQRELGEIVSGNSELSRQTVQLQQRAEELRAEFQELQEQVDKETRLLGTMEQRREQELATKRAIIGFYDEIMGIRIEPVSNECIKIILTKIDPSQPLRPFSITIDHSRDRYSVSECIPSIPDMPSIVAALNQSHDFCQFVCRTRRRFQEIFAGKH